jgi:hypothetical protein
VRRTRHIIGTGAALLLMCSPAGDGAEPRPAIVINEFMTANEGDKFTDEYGDADDWIELYNGGDTPVNAGGLFLSDDSLHLHAYTLPDTLLPPGGYLLVWADDEPLEGTWHAPFKLSWKRGDEIILTKGAGSIVDRYRFFPENGNPLARVPGTSFGRNPDGADDWGQQTEPTPGTANRGSR